MSPIELYFTKMNIVKQEYIDYLRMIAPSIIHINDPKTRKDLLQLIWDLQFGEDGKEDKIKTEREAFDRIKHSFKKLVTLEGIELDSGDENQIKQFKEWVQ